MLSTDCVMASEVPLEEFHLSARPSLLTGRLRSKGQLIVIVIPI